MKVLPRDTEAVESQLKVLFTRQNLTVLAYQVTCDERGNVGAVAAVQKPNDQRFYTIWFSTEVDLTLRTSFSWCDRASTLEAAIKLFPADEKPVIGEVVKI